MSRGFRFIHPALSKSGEIVVVGTIHQYSTVVTCLQEEEACSSALPTASSSSKESLFDLTTYLHLLRDPFFCSPLIN